MIAKTKNFVLKYWCMNNVLGAKVVNSIFCDNIEYDHDIGYMYDYV